MEMLGSVFKLGGRGTTIVGKCSTRTIDSPNCVNIRVK